MVNVRPVISYLYKINDPHTLIDFRVHNNVNTSSVQGIVDRIHADRKFIPANYLLDYH